jgi:hypothetical protein
VVHLVLVSADMVVCRLERSAAAAAVEAEEEPAFSVSAGVRLAVGLVVASRFPDWEG